MRPINNEEIKIYVNSLSNFHKDLVLKIRELVLSVDKEIKEDIKWGSIAFFNKRNICGYRLAKAHVTLLFMEGAKLEDKHGILQGSGAKARTLKVSELEEIPGEAIKDLVSQALLL